jgi:hypothetical protein
MRCAIEGTGEVCAAVQAIDVDTRMGDTRAPAVSTTAACAADGAMPSVT